MSEVGIYRGVSTAGCARFAEGADGRCHVISEHPYCKSRRIRDEPISFHVVWLVSGCTVSPGNIETGLVTIGFDDARVLNRGLSCSLI